MEAVDELITSMELRFVCTCTFKPDLQYDARDARSLTLEISFVIFRKIRYPKEAHGCSDSIGQTLEPLASTTLKLTKFQLQRQASSVAQRNIVNPALTVLYEIYSTDKPYLLL